jgi:hypothetical protein
LLLLAGGCSIPAGELAAFRSAAQAAREAGEVVVLDYGAALMQRQTEKAGETKASASQRLAFRAKDDQARTADPVRVRMLAWEVVGRYEQALEALADGRSSAEVATAVNQLYMAVSDITEAAADVAPFAKPAIAVVQGLQRAIEVGQFKRCVREAQPMIAAYAGLLLRDSEAIYNVRLGMRHKAYSRKTDQLADLRSSVTALLAGTTLSSDDASASDLARRANQAIEKLPDWKAEDLLQLPAPGDMAYTAALHAQAGALVSQIEAVAAEALAVDEQFLAYRDMMVRYVALVNQMDESHRRLSGAADRPGPPPSIAGIMETAIAFRQALRQYQDMR